MPDTSKPECAKTVEGPTQNLDPEIAERLSALRAQVRDSFGRIVLAMTAVPRYRHQTLADLQHLIMEPLLHERIAMAYPKKDEDSSELAGMAIWASVSEEVDAKIREQIKAGVFPIRLKAEDWRSGEINWLLDVIAPNEKLTELVIRTLAKEITGDDLRMHPIIARFIDADLLKSMGAQRSTSEPPPKGTE